MSSPVQDASTPDAKKSPEPQVVAHELKSEPVDETNGAKNQQAKLKVQARGMSFWSSVRQLIEDANAAGISARFYKGLAVRQGRRDVYIVAESEAALEEAKQFFQKWVEEHPDTRRPNSKSSGSAQASEPVKGSDAAEAADSAGTAESAPNGTAKDSAEPAADEPEKAANQRKRFVTFVDIPADSHQRKQKKQEKQAKLAEKAKSEAVAAADPGEAKPGPTEAEGGKSAARNRRSKSPKSKKAAAPSAPSATEETRSNPIEGSVSDGEAAEPAEAVTADTNTSDAEPKEAKEAKEPQKAKDKRLRKRTPQLKVSQTDTVYVKLPLETSMEELRALLPDFPSVEISMGTLPQRTRRINGRKVTFPEVATATITVGGEHQHKAIEILKTKEIRGQSLNPKPAFRRVLAKEHELQHAEATPEPDGPQAEHVESKY